MTDLVATFSAIVGSLIDGPGSEYEDRIRNAHILRPVGPGRDPTTTRLTILVNIKDFEKTVGLRVGSYFVPPFLNK